MPSKLNETEILREQLRAVMEFAKHLLMVHENRSAGEAELIVLHIRNVAENVIEMKETDPTSNGHYIGLDR